MRIWARFAALAVWCGSLLLSQPSPAAPACPTSAEIPARINAARLVLSNPPSGNRALVSEEAVITGLVSFVVARGKAEVQIWLVRSVVDTLCNDNKLQDYFSSTCKVYQSPLFKETGGISQVDLGTLANDIKTDVTYAPACALQRTLAKDLQSLTIPGLTGDTLKQYIDGLSAIGYYYTAVATKATKPIENADSLFSLASDLSGKVVLKYDTADAFTLSGAAALVAWQAVSAASQGDYAVAVTQIAVFLADADQGGTVKPVSVRVSTALRTVVALASAKDAASVSSILDSVTSPIGAWAVKQAHSDKGVTTVISLTALPGIQVGHDQLKDLPGGGSTTSYGLFLPIGFEISQARLNGAINLLVSPLDAGGLVSYANKKQVRGGTVQSTSPVTWRSIIAPGVYAAYSFHNSPFVLGVGYQRTPHLRSVALNSQTTTQTVASDRVLLFFSADVTLFMHAK